MALLRVDDRDDRRGCDRDRIFAGPIRHGGHVDARQQLRYFPECAGPTARGSDHMECTTTDVACDRRSSGHKPLLDCGDRVKLAASKRKRFRLTSVCNPDVQRTPSVPMTRNVMQKRGNTS